MALAPSFNCKISQKSFSRRTNPNFTCNQTQIPTRFPENYSFFSSFISEQKLRRRRSLVRTSSEEDPAQNGSEDDEGYSLGVQAALCVLRFYKREISPLLPRSCRYVPTCSEYSTIAYKKYGAVKGTVLTVCRMCRCNPLGGSGFDPPRWFDEQSPPKL
ncbi:UPF0161 protein [Striga hermonthica]|uniref:UPF0161 protein n=1 Tax=Striga hermonthica TaxID=68872 RepID=A0A9N7NRM6_STRHE|nr:UPF0161 protein [Striga hermonthica]